MENPEHYDPILFCNVENSVGETRDYGPANAVVRDCEYFGSFLNGPERLFQLSDELFCGAGPSFFIPFRCRYDVRDDTAPKNDPKPHRTRRISASN